MKRVSLFCLALVLITGQAYAESKFTSKEQEVGYAIGMNIGANMKQQNLEVDAEQVAAGLKAAFSGEETVISREEMTAILTAFQGEMQQKQMEKMAQVAEENMAKAKAFLTENSTKDGVKTTESGLQYKVITAGDGASPAAGSTVKVHYTGTLIDGTKFDSSYDRGEPVTFPVSGVIPGWTEALTMMKVGDKWQLTIPPELAYAERGAPPAIPPNSALIFDVELLEVQ